MQREEAPAGKMPALQLKPKKWYKYSFTMKHHRPIFKKTTDSVTDTDFPFCSKRCRLLNLGAWAAEKYVVSDPIFDEQELPEAERRELPEGGHNTDDTIH